jgi:hypothetical protein
MTGGEHGHTFNFFGAVFISMHDSGHTSSDVWLRACFSHVFVRLRSVGAEHAGGLGVGAAR